jgi:hypothetical protein
VTIVSSKQESQGRENVPAKISREAAPAPTPFWAVGSPRACIAYSFLLTLDTLRNIRQRARSRISRRD